MAGCGHRGNDGAETRRDGTCGGGGWWPRMSQTEAGWRRSETGTRHGGDRQETTRRTHGTTPSNPQRRKQRPHLRTLRDLPAQTPTRNSRNSQPPAETLDTQGPTPGATPHTRNPATTTLRDLTNWEPPATRRNFLKQRNTALRSDEPPPAYTGRGGAAGVTLCYAGYRNRRGQQAILVRDDIAAGRHPRRGCNWCWGRRRPVPCCRGHRRPGRRL